MHDTRKETERFAVMDNPMKQQTSFVIAHRLSTIRDADLILVMKDGDGTVEQGNHEDLLAAVWLKTCITHSLGDVVA